MSDYETRRVEGAIGAAADTVAGAIRDFQHTVERGFDRVAERVGGLQDYFPTSEHLQEGLANLTDEMAQLKEALLAAINLQPLGEEEGG